ncbi:MAG TPA: DUF5615 family PIN-like protein [Candidatus Angelobacter sp.]
MNILLDECAPRKLKTFLASCGHSCRTVQEAGWSGVANGELLALAEPLFDVLVSIDKGLQYQQNLAGRKIAIVILRPFQSAGRSRTAFPFLCTGNCNHPVRTRCRDRGQMI